MTTAADLMNPALVALHEEDPVGFAIDYLQQMGLHAAPVLDSDRRPVGVVTQTDLDGSRVQSPVRDFTSGVVLAVDAEMALDDLAATFVDTGLHHLVVTRDGVAVGMLSVVDALGALIGRPPRHQPMVSVFAGVAETDEQWSPIDWLTAANVKEVPAVPGLFLVRAGGDTEPVRLLRAGRASDLREALNDFLAEPPEIAVWADHWKQFRFQYRLL